MHISRDGAKGKEDPEKESKNTKQRLRIFRLRYRFIYFLTKGSLLLVRCIPERSKVMAGWSKGKISTV